jgi:flagellar basal-body rod protein FlgF
MADGMYVGMAGAAARAEQLDAIADNLANAQTPGFRAARPAFAAFLPAGSIDTGGVSGKVSPAAVATGLDRRPGATVHTGDGLDVAVDGPGFLAVRTGKDGVALVRSGRITVDADGRLRIAGHALLDRGREITVPPAGGQEAGRLTVLDGGQLVRAGGTLLRAAADAQLTELPARVRTGELELGNSSALEAALELVNVQRQFESSLQAIQTYRKLDERAAELGRVR